MATMRYPGGKNAPGTWQRIINLMPPHRIYVEPFAGSAAILRLKRPAALNIAIDLDPTAIANLYQALPHQHSNQTTTSTARIAQHGPGPVIHPHGLNLPLFRLWEGDAFHYLSAQHFTPDTLIYCDPPYHPDTRTRAHIYAHELSPRDHEHLLRILTALPCMVVLSAYPNLWYSETLKGWGCVEFQAMTRAGHTHAECLWHNYPAPTLLHDTRFLGATYREREKLRRQQKRWYNRLLAMDLTQRQALMRALDDFRDPPTP